MYTFETFGAMIDMSRNAVMSMNGIKRFIKILKKMDYNTIILYTEDTYEVNDEPYFGYLRGRYTKEEMKEIDAYASKLGMKVIPCIQTLAHLKAALRWNTIPTDCDDIMLTDDERVYELIDHMFATLSECFTSRKIHVGMDEAHMLGRGKHLDIHGYETVSAIMKRHLKKVLEIASKYQYEVMVWSDMFFRPWNGGKYTIPKATIPQDVVESFPKEIIPVYWDYYQNKEQTYSDMLENHKQLSDKTWFAGGVWGWSGLVPYNKISIQNMRFAIDACKKNNVKNIFMTMWGDDGAEGSHFAQLPALYYLSQYAKGITDESIIKKGFQKITGMDYDDFITIDCPNDVVPYSGRPRNPSKYMLYADCFNGFLNGTIVKGGNEYYQECAKKLHALSQNSRLYGYVFKTEAYLCDFLSIKYELPVKVRNAYNENNKEELKKLASEDFTKAIHYLQQFYKAFEKQWMQDNKPHGFDVQDIRIGGVLQRLRACKRRILSYTNGDIDKIDELDELLLPFGKEGESMLLNRSLTYATVNVIMHGI